MSFLYTFAIAVFLAVIFTPVSIKVAHKFGVLDQPGGRRIHKRPIPRMGGIAIYTAFWLSVFLTVDLNSSIMGLFLGSTMIFIVGIADDIRGLRPITKLVLQIAAALILLLLSISVDRVTLPLLGEINLGYAGMLLGILWIVGLVNTVNISDGLDGLAAGICMIAALVLFWSAYTIGQIIPAHLMLALAGAALGFLFFNFNPAKVFMGDSGSMFLGFIIGAVSWTGLLKTATVLGLIFPLLVLGMPLVDVLFAIIRRSWKGISITRADRGHLHHRLLDTGFTQRSAVLLLYAISAGFGLAALLCVNDEWLLAAILVLLNMVLIMNIMFRKLKMERFWIKRIEKNQETDKDKV